MKRAAATASNPAPFKVTLPNNQTITVDLPAKEIKAHKRRARNLGVSLNDLIAVVIAYRIAESPELPACPFCHKGDLLEMIQWSDELPDGTEYFGPAVRCNRCNVVAAADSWLLLGTVRKISTRHA